MSESVANTIQKESTLLEKLGQNVDLANIVMGFLGRIILDCAKNGYPIQGVKPLEIVEGNGGEFKARIEYHHLTLSAPGLWAGGSSFADYARSKSASMARALEANHELMKFFDRLVSAIDRFCTHKGLDFTTLKVQKAFFTRNNMIVIRVGKNLLDRWGR